MEFAECHLKKPLRKLNRLRSGGQFARVRVPVCGLAFPTMPVDEASPWVEAYIRAIIPSSGSRFEIDASTCGLGDLMKKLRVLVVDRESADHQTYAAALTPLGAVDVSIQVDAARAAGLLDREAFDLLIMAIDGDQTEDAKLLATARAADPEMPIIVVGSSATAAEKLQLIRGDYVNKPLVVATLRASAERLLQERRRGAEYELLRRQIERPYSFDDMIGGCAAMHKVFETIDQVADSDVDVLVVGETGTGKELVARSIHRRSRRAAGPFVPVDCGAIPESLLESEFFGHEKGSFTGADNRRIGLLEFADHGTFFLDELGELPLLLQAKLLRTLQERKIRRVGGREEIDVDVRIVAATARNLDDMIRQEHFRQDLYYRINVVRIDLPPLRTRGDDIGLLAEYLTNRYGREMGKDVRSITPEAYQVLAQYHWPGNVRELQNVIRRGLALARGPLIGVDDLPDDLVASAGQRDTPGAVGYFQLRDEHVAKFERQYLSDLMNRHHGDVRAAALEARLPRGTLYRLLKNHELGSGSFR